MIRKRGHRWCVISPDNPDWSGGCYRTKKEAEARLRQVERAKYARRGVSGVVKDYMKRVRSMRRLEDEANMAMARGDRWEAEQLLHMSQKEGRWARDIYEEMSREEKLKAVSRVPESALPYGRHRRRRR